VNEILRGSITRWDAQTGGGWVTSSFGVHDFEASDCSAKLQALLAGKTIPPHAPIPVKFQLNVQNRAFNLSGDDTTESK
jgi:hypothetical protein